MTRLGWVVFFAWIPVGLAARYLLPGRCFYTIWAGGGLILAGAVVYGLRLWLQMERLPEPSRTDYDQLLAEAAAASNRATGMRADASLMSDQKIREADREAQHAQAAVETALHSAVHVTDEAEHIYRRMQVAVSIVVVVLIAQISLTLLLSLLTKGL